MSPPISLENNKEDKRMTVNEVKKVNWVNTDWSNMKVLAGGNIEIGENKIHDFIDVICNSLARDFNISESEMLKLVKDNNKEFYALMRVLFKKGRLVKKLNLESEEYRILINTFKVPDVEYLKTTTVEKLINVYKGLSEFERIEFNYLVDDFEMGLLDEENQ